MFQHSRRGTVVWLMIVGVALVLALLAGDVPEAVAAVLLAAYMALAVIVARGVPFAQIMRALPIRQEQPVAQTEVAQEAIARARGHRDYDSLIKLKDVGLIVDEQRPDGLSLRRGRFISTDDEGIRPFAIVHVPEVLSQRTALVRFELRNEVGDLQYVYETEKWLQPGENPVLPDYRFPVRRSQNPIVPGKWTAHVRIDGGLLGIHNFSLSPALASRRQDIGADGELRERVWRTPKEDESLPLSLEELLRQQSRQQRQG